MQRWLAQIGLELRDLYPIVGAAGRHTAPEPDGRKDDDESRTPTVCFRILHTWYMHAQCNCNDDVMLCVYNSIPYLAKTLSQIKLISASKLVENTESVSASRHHCTRWTPWRRAAARIDLAGPDPFYIFIYFNVQAHFALL
jgi:hypothetical protein